MRSAQRQPAEGHTRTRRPGRTLPLCLLVAVAASFKRRLAFTVPPEDLKEATSRRALLSTGVTAGASLFLPSRAMAVLPTADTYFQGMNINNVQDPDEEEQKAVLAAERARVEAPATTIPAAAKQALEALDKVEKLIKEESYEDARLELAKPILVSLGITISPSRSKAKAQGIWATGCKGSCSGALLGAVDAIQQLEEWCFDNRIIFFNSVDKRNVQRDKEIGASRARKANTQDAIDLINEGRSSLKQLI